VACISRTNAISSDEEAFSSQFNLVSTLVFIIVLCTNIRDEYISLAFEFICKSFFC